MAHRVGNVGAGCGNRHRSDFQILWGVCFRRCSFGRRYGHGVCHAAGGDRRCGSSGVAGAVGVYRLWRDLGYAIGALLAGITADAIGIDPAVGLIAALTFASGVLVAVRLRETRRSVN